MNHFKLIVFCVFTLALSAGLVAGKLDWGSSAGSAQSDASALAAELGLNVQQCEQIRGIWEPLRQSAKVSFDEAHRLERRRDESIKALLTKEQLDQYNRITQDCNNAVLALQAKRNAQFREAVDKTKQVLTPPQREKYELLIKDRLNAREVPERPAAGVAALFSTPDFKRPNE